MRYSVKFAWVGMLTVWLASAAHAQSHVQVVQGSEVALVDLVVPTQGNYLVQVEAVTYGGDPVLHILDSAQRQIAMAEDFGDGASVSVELRPATYKILIRASWNGTGGRARLWINGRVNGEYNFGGAFLVPPKVWPLRYETTGVPGGMWNANIYALSDDGSISAADAGNGVGFFSRLEASNNRPLFGPDSVLMIATWWGRGPVRVLFNDYARDADADGVGQALEQALLSCDSQRQVGCAGVYNTQDSDRDGLSDAAETFGIDDARSPLPLPLWGSNPAHKDMFFEFHSVSTLPNVWEPFTRVQLRDAQKAYSEGSAADLGNLDGLPGINLHFDGPFQRELPSDASLFGNYGGFEVINKPGDRYPYFNDRLSSPVRRGVFRLIQVDTGGGGQASMASQRAGIGASTSTLVHEVGHFVGLQHWSRAQAEPINCAPNYQSIMNYLYGGNLAFSQGANTAVLNPSSVDEQQVFMGDRSLLRSTTGFDVDSQGRVDWNRNGVIDQIVAAPITGHRASCTAYARHETASVTSERAGPNQAMSSASPKLTRIGRRLYQFYIANGRIRWLSGELNNGACFSKAYRGDCVRAWDESGQWPGIDHAASLGVLTAGDRVFVAYRSTGGALYVTSMALPESSSLAGISASQPVQVSAWMSVESEPELAMVYAPEVNNKAPSLGVFFTRGDLDPRTNEYAVFHASAVMTSSKQGFSAPELLVGNDGAALRGRFGAGLFTWGKGAATQTCGLFDLPTGRLRYRCFDPASKRWADLSAMTGDLGWNVSGKPSVAFNFARDRDGRFIGDDSRNGTVYFSAAIGSDRIPFFGRLPMVSAMLPPNRPSGFVDLGTLYNIWTHLEPGASVAMFQDEATQSLMGAYTYTARLASDRGGNLRKLYFEPMLEGVFDAQLRDGNDFRVMERAVCVGLRYSAGRDDAAVKCHVSNQWGY